MKIGIKESDDLKNNAVENEIIDQFMKRKKQKTETVKMECILISCDNTFDTIYFIIFIRSTSAIFQG